MPQIKITATDFYKHHKCPRIVYLDHFGDKKERLPESEFTQKLMEDGLLHEKDVIKDWVYEEIPGVSNAEAFKLTLKAMKDGVELIYQGVLMHEGLVGRPDLLKREGGKSTLGDYHYIPEDIKSGKSLKEEYVMQVMLYAELLEKIQGLLPEKGFIINADKEELSFTPREHVKQYQDTLKIIKGTVEGAERDPVLISFCRECVWQNNCVPKMERERDVSLVYKLNRTHKDQLKEIGINTIDQLAVAKEKDLIELKRVGLATAQRWILQAKSLIDKKPVVLVPPKFPKSKVEVYFDIEGETELAIDYLYGCFIVEDGKARYVSFWADRPEDERVMWEAFCRFIAKIKDPVIYCYSSYEKTSLKRMKDRYGCDDAIWNKLHESLVDLYAVVLKSVILPVTSYSIKPIAKYLGFSWREKKAGGRQSLFWYAKYLEGDKNLKQLIVDYNEDDTKAMKVLKDWLGTL
ncbi:MAG TPA: TM0106 family RecB-like putative nuclease [Candidatus Nanoarchaeia archaeon]|nr:TM0106 family RecB-like putative nuclease [Candidatus Nanoarchaeia archaeon]